MLASFHEVSASPPTVVLKSLKDHYLVNFTKADYMDAFKCFTVRGKTKSDAYTEFKRS